MAINTLSVNDTNEGTRTMLRYLLPALQRVAPDLQQLLICSRANRHLFDRATEVIEVPIKGGRRLRRIFHDQVTIPRLVRGRADVLVTPTGVGPLRTPVPHVVIVAAHLPLPSCQRLAGDAGLDRWHRIYYGAPFRRSLRNADAVLGISQFIANGLVEELGVQQNKVGAMPLGVEGPGERPPLQGRAPFVLVVGTLYGYKDALTAVRAFALAKPRLSDDARLVVAGKDPHGRIPSLRDAAAAAGVAPAVDFLGPVSDETLEYLYARASLLLMPSRCEGFGLPVAEAMSWGLPVVVSNSTSLPEVAGGAGVLIEPGNAASFGEAIVTILSNPSHRLSMAQKGLARAGELSWEESARRLRDAIASVTSEKVPLQRSCTQLEIP